VDGRVVTDRNAPGVRTARGNAIIVAGCEAAPPEAEPAERCCRCLLLVTSLFPFSSPCGTPHCRRHPRWSPCCSVAVAVSLLLLLLFRCCCRRGTVALVRWTPHGHFGIAGHPLVLLSCYAVVLRWPVTRWSLLLAPHCRHLLWLPILIACRGSPLSSLAVAPHSHRLPWLPTVVAIAGSPLLSASPVCFTLHTYAFARPARPGGYSSVIVASPVPHLYIVVAVETAE